MAVRQFGTMQAKPITWLWDLRIPLGKLTLCAGDAERFNTGVMLDIAARKSAACPWPDRRGDKNPAGDVLIMSGEDDAEDTLLPRLMVVGADCNRIALVKGVREPKCREVDPFFIDKHFHR